MFFLPEPEIFFTHYFSHFAKISGPCYLFFAPFISFMFHNFWLHNFFSLLPETKPTVKTLIAEFSIVNLKFVLM